MGLNCVVLFYPVESNLRCSLLNCVGQYPVNRARMVIREVWRKRLDFCEGECLRWVRGIVPLGDILNVEPTRIVREMRQPVQMPTVEICFIFPREKWSPM